MVDLTTLTKQQKEQLYAQLAYELRGASDLTPEDRDMWELIMDALEVGARSRMPLTRFLESFGKNKYREATAQVRAFVDESCADAVTRVVKMAVTATVLRCLAAHLKQRAIPGTPAVMLRSVVVLPFAVEQRFPGYAPARLLDRVAPHAA